MCFCDDKYFKVTNIRTGKEKTYTYKRAASIYKRFYKHERVITHWIFDCIRHGIRLREKGEAYVVSVNKHPECESVRNDIIRTCGVRPSRIPDRLRHLLPENRR